MNKHVIAVVVGVTAVGLAASAWAAPQKVRVQGQIQSVNAHAVNLRSYSGKTIDLALSPHTKYLSVARARLADISPNNFVGIGATGPTNRLVAVEVVIFPKSMRGTGEGHYAWSLPAAVAKADQYPSVASSPGAPPIHGTMTNGTVVKSSMGGAPPIRGTMTNGTVAKSLGKSGGTEVTVTYNGEKRVQILVKPTVPVVRLIPSNQSILTPQAKAFAIATKEPASMKLSANFVAVGKNGLTPPM